MPVALSSRAGARPAVERATGPGRLVTGRRRLRHGLGVGVILAVLLVGLLPSSGSVFVGKAVDSGNSIAAAEYFTCSNAVLADGPRFFYKLDETTGTTATDSSGQGRNGTYVGTVTKGRTDACARDSGTAVLFNGSTGYVSFGTNLQVPTTLSLEAWVQTTSTRGGVVACFGASPTGASLTADRVLYLTSAGKVAFGINYLNKSAIVSSAAVNDGKWHHLLATLDASGSSLYVDGVESATGSRTASSTYTGYFRVGYDNVAAWPSAPTSSFLNATIDNVAVYVTALTEVDAVSHYQAGV